MEEIKVRFSVQDQELIREGLAGIYFLIQGDEVIFIGEDKDIKRRVQKFAKKGLQFDVIGINPYNGDNKQRRAITRTLIHKYRPKHNKIKGRKSPRPKRKSSPRRQPSKEISLPQSKMDLAKPRNQNGTVQLSEPTAEMVAWLMEQGLGTRAEILQQAVERFYQERKASLEDTQPTFIVQDEDQPEAKQNSIISDEARDALIAWTQKLNQEAFSEMELSRVEPQTVEAPEPDVLAQTEPSIQADHAQDADEESSDLPEWLTNLRDETLFGDISIERNNIEQVEIENTSQKSAADLLPDWITEPSQPSAQTPAFTTLNQEAEHEEVPEWMSDIDMSKPRSTSISPFV